MTLMHSVVPPCRSRRKMSSTPLVSPETRFVAALANPRNRPLGEIDAYVLSPFPRAPPVATLAITVVPWTRSRTKTSMNPLVSPATRFVAELWNATNLPSAERTERSLFPFDDPPPFGMLTRVVVPVWRSRRKMSLLLLASEGTRFEAWLEKTTYLPSGEIE